MPLAAFNAKVQQTLGNTILGKDLWGNYFGVELEAEIDPKSQFVTNYVNSFPEEKRSSLFQAPKHHDTPVAHYVGDSIYPLIKEFAIVKRDGSLSNGLEVVSLPMSLDFHYTQWDNFFNAVDKFGLTVSRTCGMHVHASRENLSSLQIGKVLAFLHNPANIEFVKAIAGRTPPKQYANLSDSRKITDFKRHTNRYDGFNLTNGATVEFRIFKGTLKKERMLVNIEFCYAILSFAFPGVVSIQDNNLPGFLNYVANQRKLFPYLFSFLVAKKFY